MPRPLELLDLPQLLKHRNDLLSMDIVRLLTRGNPLGAINIFSHLNPARQIYSAIHRADKETLLGSITHQRGELSAKLLYLAPNADLTPLHLIPLIEYLATQAGDWQANHLLADVDQNSPAFDALRQTGFSIYAWQRMWKVNAIHNGSSSNIQWRSAESVDLHNIHSLYYQIIPPLLQPIESAPKTISGLMIAVSKSFAQIFSGPRGVVLVPYIHPETENISESLAALISKFGERSKRPLYVCVRSYQTWLETALEDLGAQPSPRMALMAKHLAQFIKEKNRVKSVAPANVIPASRVSKIKVKK